MPVVQGISRAVRLASLAAARLGPLVLIAAATSAGPPLQYRWREAVSGMWNDPTRWELAVRGADYPGGPGEEGTDALIDLPSKSPYTVSIVDEALALTTLTINSSAATVDLSATSSIDADNLAIHAGALSVHGVMYVYEELPEAFQIGPAGMLDIFGEVETYAPIGAANEGTMNVHAGGSFLPFSGGFSNVGTLNLGDLDQRGVASSEFYGTLYNDGGASVDVWSDATIDGQLVNAPGASVDVRSSLAITADAFNEGEIVLHPGADLHQPLGTLPFTNTTTGELTIHGGGSLYAQTDNNGQMTLGDAAERGVPAIVEYLYNLENGVLDVLGPASVAQLENIGTVSLHPGAELYVLDGLQNHGVFKWFAGANFLSDDPFFYNIGLLELGQGGDARGVLTVNSMIVSEAPGSVDIKGPVETAFMSMDGGTVTIEPGASLSMPELFSPSPRGGEFTRFDLYGGTLDVQGTMTVENFFASYGGGGGGGRGAESGRGTPSTIQGEVHATGSVQLESISPSGSFTFVMTGQEGSFFAEDLHEGQRLVIDASTASANVIGGFFENAGSIDLIADDGFHAEFLGKTGFDPAVTINTGVIRTLAPSESDRGGGGTASLGLERHLGILDISIDTLIDSEFGIGFLSGGEIILRNSDNPDLYPSLTIQSQGLDVTASIRGNGTIVSENESGRPHFQIGPISPGFDEPGQEIGFIAFDGAPEFFFTDENGGEEPNPLAGGPAIVGEYICDIRGYIFFPLVSNDHLDVFGPVRFGTSRLTLRLAPAYVPNPGDRFTIMNWGAYEGEFSEVVVQGDAHGATFVLEYFEDHLDAFVPPLCFGDATGDNMVNFADITEILTFWLFTYDHPFGQGDANHNGEVNFEDITDVLTFFNISCGK